jgi:DNA repair exonuclease SbcCD nuclease subunit
LEQKADAILLSGDVFDTARVSEKTRRFVGDAVVAHPQLAFFYVAVNHDASVPPLFPDDTPPTNWYAFPDDGWASVMLGDRVQISGTCALASPGIFDRLPSTAADCFHVVMLHGEVVRGEEMGEDRIPLKLLQNRGIDYLALGHEHAMRVEPLDRRGLWAYAGCPEGRGFDECGTKGCLLLDTDAPIDSRVTFIPTGKRTLHEIPVNIESCGSFSDILDAVKQAVQELLPEDMVKVVLTGNVPPELPRDTVHIRQWLKDHFYLCRVKDECRLAIRLEDYQYDVSLKGEFIRTVLASRMNEEQKQRTIEYGLRALRGEEVDA